MLSTWLECEKYKFLSCWFDSTHIWTRVLESYDLQKWETDVQFIRMSNMGGGFPMHKFVYFNHSRVKQKIDKIDTCRYLVCCLELIAYVKDWFVQCNKDIVTRRDIRSQSCFPVRQHYKAVFTMSVRCHGSIIDLIWSYMLLRCKAPTDVHSNSQLNWMEL